MRLLFLVITNLIAVYELNCFLCFLSHTQYCETKHLYLQLINASNFGLDREDFDENRTECIG